MFSPLLEDRRLNFLPAGNGFTDRETHSNWTILGQATGGPLRGKRLTPIVHGNHFWFSWVVFKPQTRVYKP